MADPVLYLLLAAAVVVSFWASIMEATYLTVKPHSLFTAGKEGSPAARQAMEIVGEKTKLVSVTTFIDTVANVLLASTVGIILSEALGVWGWVVSVLLGSLLILIFLYLVPKSIGIEHSLRMAVWLAPSTHLLVGLLSPVATPLTSVSARISHLFVGRYAYNPSELVDELEDIIDMLEEDGHIEPDAGRLLRTTLASSSYDASDVATRIERIVAVDSGSTVLEALRLMSASLHPRLPVRDGNGAYVGAVTFRSLAKAISAGRLSDGVSAYTIQAARVESDDSMAVVTERMSKAGSAIAFVYDGDRMVGVITLTDLLEKMLGLGAR